MASFLCFDDRGERRSSFICFVLFPFWGALIMKDKVKEREGKKEGEGMNEWMKRRNEHREVNR